MDSVTRSGTTPPDHISGAQAPGPGPGPRARGPGSLPPPWFQNHRGVGRGGLRGRDAKEIKCRKGHTLVSKGVCMDTNWACDGRDADGGCKSGTMVWGDTKGMERFR